MDSSTPPVVCPHCHAENPPGTLMCWICLQPLAEPASRPPAVPSLAPQRTFSLGSLMLVIALIAVCFGVFRETPGLGVALVIVLAPAFLHTLRNVYRRKAEGRPMSAMEKFAVFFSALGMVMVVGTAAGIAFFAMCWVGLFGGAAASQVLDPNANEGYASLGWSLILGGILGSVAAILVGYQTARRFRKKKGP